MGRKKMLGVLAVAALAVMAFGASSAAAAKVCSTSGTGVECGGSHGKK
jgi:predicted porin